MATLAANVAREADLQKRLLKAAERLAVQTGAELPPTFPYVHDEHYRRNDATEWSCILLERVAEAISEQGEKSNG